MMLQIIFLLISKYHFPGGRLNCHCQHVQTVAPHRTIMVTVWYLLRSLTTKLNQSGDALSTFMQLSCGEDSLTLSHQKQSTGLKNKANTTYQSVVLSNHRVGAVCVGGWLTLPNNVYHLDFQKSQDILFTFLRVLML